MAVRRRLGEYVGVAVGIVVREGHFFIIIYVVYGDDVAVSGRGEVIELCCNVRLGKRLLFGHYLKGGMAPVEAGIQNGGDHSFARILYVGRIVDTRAVHVDFVERGFGFGHGVTFGIYDALYAVQLLDGGDVVIVDDERNAVDYRSICVTDGIVYRSPVERRDELVLLGRERRRILPAFGGVDVVGEIAVPVGYGAVAEIDVEHGVGLHFNYYTPGAVAPDPGSRGIGEVAVYPVARIYLLTERTGDVDDARLAARRYALIVRLAAGKGQHESGCGHECRDGGQKVLYF